MRATLTEPARGRSEYRALGGSVLLLVGAFDEIVSMTPPWDDWGSVREAQASLFVPVLAGSKAEGELEAERLCLAVPYALVDNPMSYLGGREDYGYAKTMARFDPPDATGDRVVISAYGGDFRPDAEAGWHPLLEVAPAGSRDGDRQPGAAGWEDAAGFVTQLAGTALDLADDAIDLAGELLDVGNRALPGAHLMRDLVESVLAGRARQVFLKQFRDSADGTRACYQSVVEAPFRVTSVSGRPSLRSWEVTVHDLDSHPIAAELGVETQRATFAFDLEVDFIVETGVVVAP